MKINISREMYDELINRCKKTKVEISGTMTYQKNNEDITIKEIWNDINCIEKTTNKEIIYNRDKYIDKLIDEMVENDIHISFHTHPGHINNEVVLSYADKKVTLERAKIAKYLNTNYQIHPITIIDCVINRKEMAFYLYDEKENKNIRIPLFVDGKEIIPSNELFPMHRKYGREERR